MTYVPGEPASSLFIIKEAMKEQIQPNPEIYFLETLSTLPNQQDGFETRLQQ